MDKIVFDAAAIPVVYRGEERLMQPTIKAALLINRKFGGLFNAGSKIIAGDIEAIALVIGAGLDLKIEELRDLPDRLIVEGIVKFTTPANQYLDALALGSNPPAADDDDGGEAGREAATSGET